MEHLFKTKFGRMLVVLSYGILYMIGFIYLENRTADVYHVMECRIDRIIPFHSIFIIPYLMWFPYQFILLGYFLLGGLDHKEFYRFMAYVCGGMTCFLLVSWLYPTALNLRPVLPAGGSVFDGMVRWLYSIDTPTNVMPSLHVYNSIVFHIVFCRSFSQEKSSQENHRETYFIENTDGKIWKMLSFAMISFIIISTVMVKQHSLIDIAMGMAMAGVGYLQVYKMPVGEELVWKKNILQKIKASL